MRWPLQTGQAGLAAIVEQLFGGDDWVGSKLSQLNEFIFYFNACPYRSLIHLLQGHSNALRSRPPCGEN